MAIKVHAGLARAGQIAAPNDEPWARALLIAEELRPIRCNKGMRVLPDVTFDDAPPLDVLLVPGGDGRRREIDNPVLLGFLRRAGEGARWVTSVCTGAFLLHGAGLAENKKVTTHFASIESLRERGRVTVLERVRYVRDGRVVTSAGVSAGIDMSLWLIGQLETPTFSRDVQRYLEYDPAPPYAAAVD